MFPDEIKDLARRARVGISGRIKYRLSDKKSLLGFAVRITINSGCTALKREAAGVAPMENMGFRLKILRASAVARGGHATSGIRRLFISAHV